MATVNGLIDAALVDGADLIITFSTPTLQAALQRARSVPIVFNYVASPIAAGAGTSDTEHLPNVTGVYLAAAFKEMLALIRACLPTVRTLGTLYVPAEVNSVFYKDRLEDEMRAAGLELVAVPANSSSEVADAAMALATQRPDAICQIPGNLTASAFPSIGQAAQRARLPVFAFQSSQVRTGASIVIGRDYRDSGRQAAVLAARVMRGERPATLPFQAVTRTRLIVNLEAARRVGLSIPASIVDQAVEVVGR
jgi:putative ABC transport system substrate-binding protein